MNASGEYYLKKLLVVLNSAEETFMQAAHGFATQHPFAPTVGAVINLESTGSGGPDLVFRMRGALPVRAYAESGVARISMGALTHSVDSADVALEIDLLQSDGASGE